MRADLVAVLAALSALAPAHGLRVSAGHVNHGLRGADSDGDAAAVASLAASLGIPCVAAGARIQPGGNLEDQRAAGEGSSIPDADYTAAGARIVAAHTEDDQVETVLMRILRGSGARGLAGLYAESPVLRPFVRVRREALRGFARARGFSWREDPANRSRAFLRNRVRLDLLPALRRACPAIDAELLDIARRAADWRAVIDRIAGALRPEVEEGGGLRIAAQELARYDRDSLCALWSALAALVGVALDWRGTRRLAAFTIAEPKAGIVPLSGGWFMEARGGVYILGKRSLAQRWPAPLPTSGELRWGAFRFRVDESASRSGERDAPPEPWNAALPVFMSATVRPWAAGDRLDRSGGQGARRVKRYLSEAGVRGQDRVGWPVVVDERENVVWIPGVRRADAATERSGRPVRHYICERITR